VQRIMSFLTLGAVAPRPVRFALDMVLASSKERTHS
jgi:hypothetical protein